MMSRRDRVSRLLETLLWLAALCWLVFLVRDVGVGVTRYRLQDLCGADSLHWANGCPPREFPWRSLGEIILLGALVWWPIIRNRIKHGYWMRDWSDHPERHFSETPRSSGDLHRR